MFCAKCGAPVAAADTFCRGCGMVVGAGGASARAIRRPGGITILAVLQWLGAAVGAVAGLALIGVGLANTPDEPVSMIAGLVFLAIGWLQFTCGVGLWQLKSYGRTIQRVFAWIGLLGFPLGTIVSIVILVYLNKPGIKAIFSGRAPDALTPEEWQQVAALGEGSSPLVTALLAVVAIVVALGVVGVMAAIAVPGLLRARISANEASAIGTLRAAVSGEAAYQAQYGVYDRPECLVMVAACGMPAGGAPYLDSSFSSRFEKSGYLIEFDAGAAVSAEDARSRGLSTTSVTEYAFIATPVTPGSTGIRSFCADSTGQMCFTSTALAVGGGRCPADCEPLR